VSLSYPVFGLLEPPLSLPLNMRNTSVLLDLPRIHPKLRVVEGVASRIEPHLDV